MNQSFGVHRLRRHERQLIGPNGPVELGSREFDLLQVFLDRPDELIEKSTLLDTVWPDVAVAENTLHVHMSALRKALGPGYIATVHGRGYRYVGPLPSLAEDRSLSQPTSRKASNLVPLGAKTSHEAATRRIDSQGVRFCTSKDGVRIAYAVAGAGPPLIKTASWLNSLEQDWNSPVWRGLFQPLAGSRRLVRYDGRGDGLSDREVAVFSLDAYVSDFEAVANAAGLRKSPILGFSEGCCVAIEYAARYPERVSHLVLLGGFARGCKHSSSPEFLTHVQAMKTLMAHAWGSGNPAFRQMFSSMFIPRGTAEQYDWLDTLQKVCTSRENAVRFMEALGELDVRDRLEYVRAPTLVVHCRDDAFVPAKLGREVAAGIPGARFLGLDSNNHLLVEGEPALSKLLAELADFLNEDHS